MTNKNKKTSASLDTDNYPDTNKDPCSLIKFDKDIIETENGNRISKLSDINRIITEILEHTHIMAAYLDPQFNFLWVNRSYADSCRYDPSFFPGKNHFDLYPHEENQEIFKTVVDTGEPFYVEAKPFEFPGQPERGVTYRDWSLVPIKDANGNVEGLVFTLADVTDRIKAEEALKQQETQYQELMESANSIIIRWDRKGIIRFINHFGLNFFGYSKEELVGKDVMKIVPSVEKSTGRNLDTLVKDIVLHPRNYANVTSENITKDQKTVWITWTNKALFDDQRNVKEILAIGNDITALKETELALAESEKEKSLILDNADEMIAYYDKENNLVWANRAFQERTGMSISELKGRKCFQCWNLDQLCSNCPVIMALETGHPRSGEITPENQTYWPEDYGSWDLRSAPVRDSEGNIIGAIEIARDITEQKEAEKKLILSEKLYRTVGESIPYGIWQTDASGKCTYVSDSFLEMTGLTLQEIRDFGWLHLLDEEDREVTKEHWMHCVQTGEGFEREHRFRAKDGSTSYVLAIGRPVRDENDQITGWVGVNLDISERKGAEEAVRVLAHFPEENPNPVMRCTMDGILLYANNPAQGWLKDLGWNPEEQLPESIRNLVEAAGKNSSTLEAEILSPADRIFSIIAVRPPDEEYVNLYGSDITERKKAETALQKMNDALENKVMERTAELEWRNRELQEFAYVASHDLQEPLRKIKLFEEMLEKELNDTLTEQGKDYLRRMNRAADRMQKLVKSLLSYSRSSSKTAPFERVDLNPIVEVIAKDLLPEGENLIPIIEISALPEIDADPVQIHQLFQNLLSNAVHYHKKGEVPKVKISSRLIKRNDKRKDTVCELTVEDEGIGFDMQYVDKIFLPFERLHERNTYDGTGMGLAICRKIVERHNGRIEAHSKPGEGTKFIVSLPVRQINYE